MTKDEEVEEEIKEGLHDEDVYEETGREELVEDDEINALEEGFMEGYEGDDKMAHCQKCGKVLGKDILEREYNDETYRFCSENCVDNFKLEGK